MQSTVCDVERYLYQMYGKNTCMQRYKYTLRDNMF